MSLVNIVSRGRRPWPVAGATCPKGWCVEASPPAETAGAHWLALGWRTAADGVLATLHQLASGPWAAASSELGAELFITLARLQPQHCSGVSGESLAFYFFKNHQAFFFSVGN